MRQQEACAPLRDLVLEPLAARLGLVDVESQFYLMMEVADRPGVLAAIATVFGEHGVSIRSMQQRDKGDDARLIEADFDARCRVLATVPAADFLPYAYGRMPDWSVFFHEWASRGRARAA